MAKSSKTRRPYGSGSIRRRGDDVWEVEVCHGRRADGKRRMVSRTVHGTRVEAEAELVRLRVEMGAKPNMGDSMTLGDYFWSIFIPTREALLAPNTLATYESVYRTHIEPAFGDWDAAEIGRADVQRWAARLPPAAADKAFRHLRAILRAMWDDELLDEEPLRRRVRLPRHQLSPKGVWTTDELSEAMGRLRGHRLEGLVLAMAGGGLRREEALAIDLPGDVDVSEVLGMDGTAHTVVRLLAGKSWTTNSEQRDVTKTYRVRPVTIGEPFAPRLAELALDGRPKLAMREDGSAPLMPSSISGTWQKCFNDRGCLHGMRYVQLRTLRHLHETLAASAGMSDSVNSDLHGHSERVMYAHYLSVASSDADAMAEAVRASMGRCGANVG